MDYVRSLKLTRCKLAVLGGAARGQSFTLDADVIHIGKDPGNDVVLPDDTVSRRHCRIARTEQGWLMSDLGSTNGTTLDGVPVVEGFLRAGATVTIGGVPMRFLEADHAIEVLPWEEERFETMSGRSLVIREVFGTLDRVADTNVTVLLIGETGTGKELAARAIHDRSKRGKGPFIVVDCGSISSSLIESELFGHERGAFTGADTMRRGAFEVAAGGTLFLDEVSELPLDLQPKLLRALENREVRRLGAAEPSRVDVRILAAASKDLATEVERGKFRRDLFFRIAPVEIRIPPLRERREDVPLLVRTFLAKAVGEKRAVDVPLAEGALEALASHDWPGNVRELRNVVERAASLQSGDGPLQLPIVLDRREVTAPGTPAFVPAPEDPHLPFGELKARWEADFEKTFLPWLLERASGNVSEAARLARMDRKHLADLLKKHGVR